MWIFLATVCLGMSALLSAGLLDAVTSGRLHQYSKREGVVLRMLALDAPGFWFEVGGLALFALLLMGVGVFSVCAFITLGKDVDSS